MPPALATSRAPHPPPAGKQDGLGTRTSLFSANRECHGAACLPLQTNPGPHGSVARRSDDAPACTGTAKSSIRRSICRAEARGVNHRFPPGPPRRRSPAASDGDAVSATAGRRAKTTSRGPAIRARRRGPRPPPCTRPSAAARTACRPVGAGANPRCAGGSVVRGPSAPPAGRHCRAGAPARRAHRGFESTRKLVARLRPGPRRPPRWPLPAAGPRAAGRQQPVPRGASRHRRQRDGVGLGPRAARSGTPEVLSCRAWRTTRPAAGRAAAAARRTASRASTSPWHLRTVARKCLEQDPPGPSARGGWRAPGGGLQTRPSSSGPAGAARARAELFQPESLRELG